MAKKLGRRPGPRGTVSEHHDQIQSALTAALIKAKKGLAEPAFRKMTPPAWDSVAGLLVELAEDLHCGIGIWRSLEGWNRELFGTALPFLLPAGATLPPDAIAPERLQHYLWVLSESMMPGFRARPDHPDLVALSSTAATVLREQFAGLERGSEIRAVFEGPNEAGWDVKGKLIALGTQSFLFQPLMVRFVEDRLDEAEEPDRAASVNAVDDFLCQRCTPWSGLGCLEILAGMLDLSAPRRADLLAWSERHLSAYKVLAVEGGRLQLLNVITDREYAVRFDLEVNPFRRGRFLMGSLVPWDGAWIWSGAQQDLGKLSAQQIAQVREGYQSKPALRYRMDHDLRAKAQEIQDEMREAFVAQHGRDWHVFADARAYAEDLQRAAIAKYETLPAAERKAFLKKHGLEEGEYRVNLPRELLELEGSIGIYYDPVEGQETAEDIGPLLSGMAKRGVDLTPAEVGAIEGFIRSDVIGPGFVRRMVEEYGDGSILAAFQLDRPRRDYALDYLLRRHKGAFYRPSHPSVILLGS